MYIFIVMYVPNIYTLYPLSSSVMPESRYHDSGAFIPSRLVLQSYSERSSISMKLIQLFAI